MKKNRAKLALDTTRATRPSGLIFQRILVPIDFSKTSVKALECALGIAQKVGATVHLMHVYEPPSFMTGYQTLPITVSDDEIVQRARVDLEALVPPDLPSNIKVNCFVRTGKGYVEIAKFAKEQKTDLIVISTHGYTGLKHTFMGSTTERVVRHAHCAVLVVR
jgi:universal stress protein A